MADKIDVTVLGATGSVGQKFVELLQQHPWFRIASLGASDRSAGKSYGEAARWQGDAPLDSHVAQMPVQACAPGLKGRIAFSGLDSSVAGEIEEEFAWAGYIVVSNARNHRMRGDVPLLVPEVNGDHAEIIKKQKYGRGAIVTNPNCSTVGLVMALKPLVDRFGVEALHVVTMQALSGAGYPGVSSLDILDNVIPHIGGEEEKMEIEPAKIFGKLQGDSFVPADMKISAQCNRVSVRDGHLECVSVKLKKRAAAEDIIAAWNEFRGVPQELGLPSAPRRPVTYFENRWYPQPRLHRNLEGGMAVSTGRLQECPLLDYKFNLLVHNTIRGAAGGALLNAELLLKKGLIAS